MPVNTISMDRPGDELRHFARTALQEAGYFCRGSDDMYEWAARMHAHEAFVNQHFSHRHSRQTGAEWVGIFSGRDGSLAATMAWRIHEDADLLRMVEEGTIYHDDPAAWGHKFHETGLRGVANMAGTVQARGGTKSFDEGKGFAWWVSTFALAAGLDANVDVAGGIALPDAAQSRMPLQYYGYWNASRCLPWQWPNQTGTFDITLVWSGKAQIREECQRRLDFLRACDDKDPKRIVLAYVRRHYPHEEAVADLARARVDPLAVKDSELSR